MKFELRHLLKMIVTLGLAALFFWLSGVFLSPLLPIVFMVFGFATVFALFYFIYQASAFPRKQEMAETPSKKRLQQLMDEGEWIEVDLMKCDILEGGFYQEKEMDAFTKSLYQQSPLLGMLDEASQDPLRQTHTFEHRSQIRYRHVTDGREEVFHSSVLPMDKATIVFKAYDYGKTWLWVDRRDRTHYFMDVRFLFQDRKS